MFSSSLSLPLLVGGSGGLVCELVGKADLLSDHFDSKQSRECRRSGVTQCILFMVLYLYRMCQCTLHAVLWSHIGILMCLFVTEPHSTAGLLFSSQCLCRIILLTLHLMVWDWQVSRVGPMLLHWPKLLIPIWSLTVFPFSSFYRLVLRGWGLWTDRV